MQGIYKASVFFKLAHLAGTQFTPSSNISYRGKGQPKRAPYGIGEIGSFKIRDECSDVKHTSLIYKII